jgi:hypothetical protein
MNQVQTDRGYPDVLSVLAIAKREDNLTRQTSTERKHTIYTGVSPTTPNASPIHLYLASDH